MDPSWHKRFFYAGIALMILSVALILGCFAYVVLFDPGVLYNSAQDPDQTTEVVILKTVFYVSIVFLLAGVFSFAYGWCGIEADYKPNKSIQNTLNDQQLRKASAEDVESLALSFPEATSPAVAQ